MSLFFLLSQRVRAKYSYGFHLKFFFENWFKQLQLNFYFFKLFFMDDSSYILISL